MLVKKQKKQQGILLRILLVTLLYNTSSYAISNNAFPEDTDSQYNNKDLSFEDKYNNNDITNQYLQTLQEQCTFQNDIKIKIHPPVLQGHSYTEYNITVTHNNINDEIQQYKTIENKQYTLSYILDSLWNLYNEKYNPKTEILQKNDNILQQNTNILKAQENTLIDKIISFTNMKYRNKDTLLSKMNTIKLNQCLQINEKKMKLAQLLEPEKSKFLYNIAKISEIKKQYENLYDCMSLNDTYCKIYQLLFANKIGCFNESSAKYTASRLDTFTKEIEENISSFYESCLIGNHIKNETINDKLDVINNTLSKLVKNPTANSMYLRIINCKLSELKNSKYLKLVTDRIKELKTRIGNISIDLTQLTKKIDKILENTNIQSISNTFQSIEIPSSNKYIIPTTDNVLNWCAENYEDWDEELFKYEDIITNNFKIQLNTKQITKHDLDNTFNALHKIAMTNAKIENYYRTAKLLHNVYPLRNSAHPIILPSSLAV